MASLLNKFVDADQWDADDIAGRLGLILHAAFLFAGFQPYGAQPRSGHPLLKKQSRKKGTSLCLSRQYTAPDLAHRDGDGADAAVLMLCVQGSDVAFLVFLTTDDTPENAYLERLDLGTVTPLLSRSLRTVERRASRICKALADGVCWSFLDEICRRNGVPLSGFESLPDDLKAAVLTKLTDGKDLARVECVSSQLRLLVAERNHELWKTMYEARPARQRRGSSWPPSWLFPDAESSDDEEQETLSLGSTWKNMYVEARRRRQRQRRPRHMRFLWCLHDCFEPIRIIRRKNLSSWPLYDFWFMQDPPEEEKKTVPPRVDRNGSHRRQKLARNDYKRKWHGGGAIHSPSSRYR